MNDIKFIWLNGDIVPYEKSGVSILSHSLHYGSAVFEGIRCYKTEDGPAIFRLKDHIGRLFNSSSVVGMDIPYSREDIISAVIEVVKHNELKECYIRPIIFYGDKMGLLPTDASLHFAIIAWEWDKYFKKESVSVRVSSFKRIHPDSAVLSAKVSGHYSNSIMASLEARASGYDEALFLDHEGCIAEGPGENIFFIKDDVFHTPREGKIFPGITRDSIIFIINNMGFKVEETDIKPEDIEGYDEAFFVGTATEVNSISKIDGHIFGEGGEGPKTEKVRDAYKATVSGRLPAYKHWLDFVK